MRRVRRRAAVASLLAMLLSFVSPAAGAQESRRRRCKRAVIGVRPPTLTSAQGTANALRRKVNFRLWWTHRYFAAFFSTPFKKLGVFGWSDYCQEACAYGSVLHADRSIDGIYTVDLALSSFIVNGEQTRLDGPRFIRAEIFRKVRKATARLPHKGDAARICGKLMWDGDGFLEIHPRSSTDIERDEARPQRAAAP